MAFHAEYVMAMFLQLTGNVFVAILVRAVWPAWLVAPLCTPHIL